MHARANGLWAIAGVVAFALVRCASPRNTPSSTPLSSPAPVERLDASSGASPASADAAAKTAEPPFVAGVLKLLRGQWSQFRGMSPADLRAMVARLRAVASPRERPILDHLMPLLEDASRIRAILHGKGSLEDKQRQTTPIIERMLRGEAAIARELAALEPNDLHAQAAAAGTLYSLPDLARSLEVPDSTRYDEWRQEGIARADDLIRRFPASPLPYSLRGEICLHQRRKLLECARYYAKCKKRSPPGARCAETYRELAHTLTAPRCRNGTIRPGLRLFTGTLMSGPSTRPIKPPRGSGFSVLGQNGPVYVDARPGFALRDVVSVARASVLYTTSRTWDADAGAFGPTTKRDVPSVVFTIKKQRRAAFDAWVKKTVDPGISTWFVVLDGKRWVGAGSVPVNGDPMHIEHVSLTQICTNTERPPLPPGLPAP